jgi:hypothetical protein
MNTVGGTYNYLYSFFLGLTPLVSGILAMSSAKKWGGFSSAIGKAVFFIGLGICLWGCGDMVWSYYNFFKNIPAPYPSYPDLGFAPSIFFYTLGAIYLADATGAKMGFKSIPVRIFTVAAPVIILAISYYVLVIIARDGVLVSEGDSRLKTLFDVLYPVGDSFGLTIAILFSGFSFKYMKGRYTVDVWAILLGLAAMFFGDFIFSCPIENQIDILFFEFSNFCFERNIFSFCYFVK